MSDNGWFTGDLSEAQAMRHEQVGIGFLFGESRPHERFHDIGMNVRVLEPGQAASLYHSEAVEEFFLVLGGECLAIVEDEEVRLGQWQFLHCPPGTAHVIVGAGDGPASVLMVGGRRSEEPPRYPVSDVAARYGASVSSETNDGREAWAQVGWQMDFDQTKLPWPP